MSYPIKQEQKLYTYQDYLNPPDNQRYEIIDGILYMTPAPSTQHQRVLRKLFIPIGNYLEGKTCEVFIAPYDVLLSEEDKKIEDIKNIVQPDILVICEQSKITERHCIGSPDFIMEIVSPSAASRDYVKKLHLYEKHKVREYWIVNYIRKEVLVYKLQENGEEYGEAEIYTEKSKIRVGIFEDLLINMEEVFA